MRLARLDLGHAASMLRWMRDPRVRLEVGVRARPTAAATRRWIARATRDAATAPFAILLAGRHVGNVVLDRIDRHLGTARLSVYVGEADVRGAGVGRAAVSLALDRAFRRLRLRKVWLTVHDHNRAAIEAYLALGFVVEGVLREEFRRGRARLDALYMGILAREWRG